MKKKLSSKHIGHDDYECFSILLQEALESIEPESLIEFKLSTCCDEDSIYRTAVIIYKEEIQKG